MQFESSAATLEKEPAFKPGDTVFIPRSDGGFSSAAIVDIRATGVLVMWAEGVRDGRKIVQLEDLLPLTDEAVRSVYKPGVVVNIPRGADKKKRSNITIQDSVSLGHGKVMLSWEEDGKSASKIFDCADIQKAAAIEKEIPLQVAEKEVVEDPVVEIETNDEVRIDLEDEQYRDSFYNEVRELVEEATVESKKVLQKRDEYTGSGEWPTYHKLGLQAANTARLLYRGNFTMQFSRLEKLLVPTDKEELLQIGMTPEEILAREEAKEMQIDALKAQINRTYTMVQKQIEKVRDAVRAAEDAMPEESSEIAVAPDTAVAVVATEVASPQESIKQSKLAVEKINITVEGVYSLPLKEQIAAYVAKVKEVSQQVNERLAKFGPGQVGAESRQKLVAIHDRLVRLSERLEERLHEADESILKLKVPKTIRWVKEDLATVQNLVAEVETVALTEAPVAVPIPDLVAAPTPALDAIVPDSVVSEVVVPAVINESIHNDTTSPEVLSPFARTELSDANLPVVNFNRSAGDSYSNKNLSFKEEGGESDTSEEAVLFERANAIAKARSTATVESPVPVAVSSEPLVPTDAMQVQGEAMVTIEAEPLAVAEEVVRAENQSPLVLSTAMRVRTESPAAVEVTTARPESSPTMMSETGVIISRIDAGLARFTGVELSTLTAMERRSIERLAFLKRNLAGRGIIQANYDKISDSPLKTSRVSVIEAANQSDSAAVDVLLQTLAQPTSAEVISKAGFLQAKNDYRDALVHALQQKANGRQSVAFGQSEQFAQLSTRALDRVDKMERTYRAAFAVAGNAGAGQEIKALEAEFYNEAQKSGRLQKVARVLAVGLGLIAPQELGDGTQKTDTVPNPAPYSASEISMSSTLVTPEVPPQLTVIQQGAESATNGDSAPYSASEISVTPTLTTPEATPQLKVIQEVVPSQTAPVPAFDTAYPAPTQSAVEDIAETASEAQVDRWGSVQSVDVAPKPENIPALTIHDFRNGEGLIKVGRGVTEVGPLSVMEHIPTKQRESVIDLTVARIMKNPTLLAELNVGLNAEKNDVSIFAGRPLNLTAYERELEVTAKAVGIYIESEKTGTLIPPRPATVEVTPVKASSGEINPVAQIETPSRISTEDLQAFVQNFEGGPAALADSVAKWVQSVEGSYFIAPGNRLLSMFSQQEYVDPYKALAKQTVSDILNIKANKNILAYSQKLNELRITAEGFAQWANRLEKFVRQHDVRGASDLTLERAAELMYADAELTVTTNVAA